MTERRACGRCGDRSESLTTVREVDVITGLPGRLIDVCAICEDELADDEDDHARRSL